MYRTIYTQLWTDPKVRSLSKDGKLLFLYLLTNPYTHVSGIYHLPGEMLRQQTGISDTLCDTLWHTLSDTLSIAYRDLETHTVWIVKMFSYQGQGPKNEQAAVKHLETLHHSTLIPQFLEYYPSVKALCPDTLSIPYRYPFQNTPSVPNPVLLTSSPVRSSDLRSNGSAKLKGKRAISEEDRPTERHVSFAKTLGLDAGPEWGKFKNYCLAHDKRYANFEAAFRNWLANANEMKRAGR